MGLAPSRPLVRALAGPLHLARARRAPLRPPSSGDRGLTCIVAVAPEQWPCVPAARFQERRRSGTGAALPVLRRHRVGCGPWPAGSDSLAPAQQALLPDRMLNRADVRKGEKRNECAKLIDVRPEDQGVLSNARWWGEAALSMLRAARA